MKITAMEKQLILHRRMVKAEDNTIFQIINDNFKDKKVFIGIYDTIHELTVNIIGTLLLWHTELIVKDSKNMFVRLGNLHNYLEKIPLKENSMELISKDKKVTIALALKK
jgi:hypothetical protein